MILALTSALALISEPVACELTPLGEELEARGTAGFTVECPAGHADAAAIQSAAETAIAAMDLPVPEQHRRGRNFPPRFETSDALVVEPAGGAWRAAPGQALVRAVPVFPVRAAERGAVHMLCALAFRPDAAGTDTDPAASCISNVSNSLVERWQNDAMMRAGAVWRFAPVNVQYCLDEQVMVTAALIDGATGRPEALPPAPDPALLANLCEAG